MYTVDIVCYTSAVLRLITCAPPPDLVSGVPFFSFPMAAPLDILQALSRRSASRALGASSRNSLLFLGSLDTFNFAHPSLCGEDVPYRRGATGAAMPDVCVATVLASSRLSSLQRLITVWPGPVAAAVLARNDRTSLEQQRDKLLKSLNGHRFGMAPRIVLVENIGYDCPPRFPSNLLSNLALSLCTEKQVLFVDVDFVPLPLDLAYQELSSPTLQETDLFRPEVTPEQVVVVLPAFEWVSSDGDQYIDPLTVNKSMLRPLIQKGRVIPFGTDSPGSEVWPPAHDCSRTERWMKNKDNKPLGIAHCNPYYEPHLLMSRRLTPSFDESFMGKGFDKVSFVYELFARGMKFMTSRDSFVMRIRTETPATPKKRESERSACSSIAAPAQTVPSSAGGASSGDSANSARSADDASASAPAIVAPSTIASRSAAGPKRDTLNPDSNNPGESCVPQFLERVSYAYNYLPLSEPHWQFRGLFDKSRGKVCVYHTEWRLAIRPRILMVAR